MSTNDTFGVFQKQSGSGVPGYIMVILPQVGLWVFLFILMRIYICFEKQPTEIQELVEAEHAENAQNAKYRADTFLATFPPDSQAALQELHAQAIQNISMVQRKFHGFETNNNPDINISEMIESVVYNAMQLSSKEIWTTTSLHLLLLIVFNLSMLQMDPDVVVSIGFATCPHPNFRLPGYDQTSIGYHSSGRLFINDRGVGKPVIPFKVAIVKSYYQRLAITLSTKPFSILPIMLTQLNMSTDLSTISVGQYQFNNYNQYFVYYAVNNQKYQSELFTAEQNLPVSDSFIENFATMLLTDTNVTRNTDDLNYWTNEPNSLTVFANANEQFNQSLTNTDNSILKDTIELFGNINLNAQSSFFNFTVGSGVDLGQLKDSISNWNKSLIAGKKDLDSEFNTKLTAWLPALNLSAADLNGLAGQFNGAVGSVNTGGIYFGNFALANVSFSFSNLYANYTVDSAIQFLVAGLSNIYLSADSHLVFNCQSVLFKGPKGAPINIFQVQSIITPQSGIISFVGQAGYVLVYKAAKETLLSIFVRFAPTVVVSILMLYWVVKSRKKQAEERQRYLANRIEMNTLTTVARADTFSSTYPPDSEAAILEMDANDALPISMRGLDTSTFMCIRQFQGFEFEGIQPSVDIQKMNSGLGTQIIEFVTIQECTIQTNSCLKPRLFGNDLPQPPPSFEDESVLFNEAYFEVKLLERQLNSAKISVGFATCPYPPFRLPGYDYDSIGYHSDSGNVYLNDRNKGEQCGPQMVVGDTVGIGYRIIELPKVGDHILNQTVFYFTHNGTRIGDEYVADGFYPDKIYPSIGSTGNCKLQVTFGDVSIVFHPPTKFIISESSPLQEVQIDMNAAEANIDTDTAVEAVEVEEAQETSG
ncbi:Rsp5p-dependent ubiquitination, sorting of cargo proteins at the multivesicular body [Boothiomyces sp. JEL0866]|nr:Rsp5p-dependent ubiquitination, sorting of cargo proteins at the multivesicular body [Boothiomyces sp. JEL0866]